MNDLSPIAADQAAVVSSACASDAASATIAAAEQLLPHLESGQRVDATILRAAMEAAEEPFEASGAKFDRGTVLVKGVNRGDLEKAAGDVGVEVVGIGCKFLAKGVRGAVRVAREE